MTEVQDQFLDVYEAELLKEVQNKPDEYFYPESQVPTVAKNMVKAWAAGTGNIDSNPLRRTCRKLGIKHGVKSIREYLNKELCNERID